MICSTPSFLLGTRSVFVNAHISFFFDAQALFFLAPMSGQSASQQTSQAASWSLAGQSNIENAIVFELVANLSPRKLFHTEFLQLFVKVLQKNILIVLVVFCEVVV